MRKMERILGGNIMWVNTLEGVDGYIQNYLNLEDNEWESRHIDKLSQIFDIPYSDELVLHLTAENIKALVDNKLIIFDEELNFHKLCIYDELFKIANPLITKYTKDKGLDGKVLSESHKGDNYFSVLRGIDIDINDNTVIFDGNSNYIELQKFQFPLDCISHIIDIDKLKSTIKDKFDVSLKDVYIKCMQYPEPSGEWCDCTIYVATINDEQYYTYKLFEDCNFIK